MDTEELKALQAKFHQGMEKLGLIRSCLAGLQQRAGLEVATEEVDPRQGELCFWFAGQRYYVRVRLTDRGVDNVGAAYNVPIGWLDWGRFSAQGVREAPEQSNYFDDRGILCELEKEEFYCNFRDCEDQRLLKGMLLKLQRLVGRTIAVNNARSF